MDRTLLAAGLCLAALGLSACEQDRPMAANRGICFDFRAARPASSTAGTAGTAAAGTTLPAVSTDAGTAMDDCVRRWAYSLAPSRDIAQEVANAAVGACSRTLARWNEQSLSQTSAPQQAPSITTGELTSPLAEHNAYAHARALLYVVAARAGHCAPPPATDGAPQGVMG